MRKERKIQILVVVVAAVGLGWYVRLPNVPHGEIVITSDRDFELQGWPGVGAPGDPYVIQGLTIRSWVKCISISNTSKWFVIRNCYIGAPYGVDSGEETGRGIVFENVAHGAIEYCVIEKTRPVIIDDSSNCRLSHNDIRGSDILLWASGGGGHTFNENTFGSTGYTAAYFANSRNCRFQNNTILAGLYAYNCEDLVIFGNKAVGGWPFTAFELVYSTSCEVIDNDVSDWPAAGVIVAGCDWAFVGRNHVTGVTGHGLRVSGDYSTVVNNTISHSTGSGLVVGGGECMVTGNQVANNSGCGLVLTGSSECQIRQNNLCGNLLDGLQAHDSGNIVIMNNIIRGNNGSGIGLSSCSSPEVRLNTVYDNGRYGIHMTDCYRPYYIDNVVYNNSLGDYMINRPLTRAGDQQVSFIWGVSAGVLIEHLVSQGFRVLYAAIVLCKSPPSRTPAMQSWC